MSIRVRLIMPNSHMHAIGWLRWRRSMREAPLTLTTLAALGPAELDIEWQLIDGTVQRITWDGDCDLVGISLLSGTAAEGYRIAKHFRNMGIPVVLGGVHATLCADEASEHADAVVVGMAERTWPTLLRDFVAGTMKKRYVETQPKACIDMIPSPRVDLMRRWRYNAASTVMTSRGCDNRCQFCISGPLWGGYLHRPIEDILRDVDATPGRILVFNDVNLLSDRAFAMELLGKLKQRRRIWGGLFTLDTADDYEMLELLQAAGCRYVLVGMESLSHESLDDIGKGFNHIEHYRRQIQTLHDFGISVQACLMFGMDHDTVDVFDTAVEMTCDLKVDIPRYSLLTPFPETEIFRQMEKQERITSRHWDDYDTMHVVFQPAQMSQWELFEGFKKAYRKTFSFRHIRQRFTGGGWRGLINSVGNLTYRHFVNRLDTQRRFAAPNRELLKGERYA